MNYLSSDLAFIGTIFGGAIVLGKAVSDYIHAENPRFLEAYGGCDCEADGCEKIDTLEYRGKGYTRVPTDTDSKMNYRYSKIYNVTQACWAHDVSGNDDAKKIWHDNEWDENDALVGFYSDSNTDYHNVIFCRPGYAVYVQSEEDKQRAEFAVDGEAYRVPPAVLVNLNDAFDSSFLLKKAYPDDAMDCDTDDDESVESDDSDESDDSEDDDDDEDEDEDEDDEDEEDVADDESEEEFCEHHLVTHIKENQKVIEFLYRCKNATNNDFKKKAYDVAINEVHSYWSVIYPETWKPQKIGSSIERKIREFMDGTPEADIINS